MASRAALLVGIYFLVFGYPPLRLAATLSADWRPDFLTLALVLVAPAAGWLAYRAARNAFTRLWVRASYTWLGICFVMLVMSVPWEIVVWLFDLRPPVSGLLLLTATGLTTAQGFWNAGRLGIHTEQVAAPGLSAPLRLVQVSDVHVGSRAPAFLARVVERINRTAPDLVVITGDLVDFHGIDTPALAPLARLCAPGYFCIGNHERYVDCEALCERIAAHGVHVLRDAACMAGEVQLIGIDDAEDRQQVRKQLAAIAPDPAPFTVLLYHRPDDFEAAVRAGVDLMLCGHTHNGQIVPFNLLVKRVFPRLNGRYRRDGASLYVSPGTGTWGPPLRLGSQNEITVFELSPAPVRS